MKRKNTSASNKVVRKTFVKNIKINKIYKVFKSKLNKHIKLNKFAVGVSGGSDSLSLAYFSAKYQKEFKNKVFFFIVDHKIKKDSSKESTNAKKILKKKGINAKILTWKGSIPFSNIQSKARLMRYSLIEKECTKNRIPFLLTAHHQDDQIETFLIRLTRGSGINGLSSMSEVISFNNNLKIIRPLLKVNKDDLKYVASTIFKDYINDPANENKNFLRVRIRNLRRSLELDGFKINRILNTINNLKKAKKALEFYKNLALKKHVKYIKNYSCIISINLILDESEEITFRCFSEIFVSVSGTYYPPRSTKISRLINSLKKVNFKKSSLGNCLIQKKTRFYNYY
ncbi:MAG: tRNA lysidine(34) synthetase TilS [Candidatus Pelagibacter sp. TMED64]|nr:tRNA lysidine(34) synthetase TilS [Candidatus Pelagibacter sp.]OUU65815.1 MAG: tRNA lysidine(34) synthetase TilS [Candidatus Pelagibacter sp. TMED64]